MIHFIVTLSSIFTHTQKVIFVNAVHKVILLLSVEFVREEEKKLPPSLPVLRTIITGKPS